MKHISIKKAPNGKSRRLKCFNRSSNVKWVYNYEQANTVYRTPDG